jgi:EAL domain-containing protein (putative c-di-GMP-specific phosphodiesterase class I)
LRSKISVTGHSSLAGLRRFRVDRIKIAQTFIEHLDLDSESAPIVRATISLARELGITVVAEGVDTQAQLALLESWGCHEIRGDYFAEPLSATDLGELLRLGSIQPGWRRLTRIDVGHTS